MDRGKRKNVTMADIAEAVGVSKNAVSLALTGKPGVGETMRMRIIETAQMMGYHAPSEKGAERACIVVVVPWYIRDDGTFYSDIFWVIEHETRKQGYITLTIGLSQEMEQQLILPEGIEDMNVLGYLAVGIIRTEYLQKLHETGKQVVCVDIHNSAVPLTCVAADNLYGGFLATQHLIEKGHRRIGFAGPIFNAQSVFERWCGFQQAMQTNDLAVQKESCILGSQKGFELLDNSAILSGYLDQITQMPTAWFCAGDMIAIAMLKLLRERGYQVPDDVSIVSFDDLKIADMVSPALSTIHVDRALMGKQSVYQLINQALSRVPASIAHISLPCYLVERESVKDLR